jgi:hypothetical protein
VARVPSDHRRSLIEIELVDRLVGSGPGPAVESQDLGGGLVRLGPQVRVGVVLVERERFDLPPERLAEPPVLHASQVLHQADQVRPPCRLSFSPPVNGTRLGTGGR